MGLGIVSKQDGVAFGIAGLAAWGLATAYYVAFGPQLLESAFWFYCANAFLAAVASAFMFHAAVRLRRTPVRHRPAMAVLFAAPGLVLGPLVALNMTSLLPELDPVSIGRYAAFVFVSYVTVGITAFERPVRATASPAR